VALCHSTRIDIPFDKKMRIAFIDLNNCIPKIGSPQKLQINDLPIELIPFTHELDQNSFHAAIVIYNASDATSFEVIPDMLAKLREDIQKAVLAYVPLQSEREIETSLGKRVSQAFDAIYVELNEHNDDADLMIEELIASLTLGVVYKQPYDGHCDFNDKFLSEDSITKERFDKEKIYHHRRKDILMSLLQRQPGSAILELVARITLPHVQGILFY
jgi:hypothetical protein